MALTDDRTPHLDLPLPHQFNDLPDDVERLRDSLTALDTQAQTEDARFSALSDAFDDKVISDDEFHQLVSDDIAKLNGGTINQVLRKTSNTNLAVEWADPMAAVQVIVVSREETQTLAAGQVIVDLIGLTTDGISVYIEGIRLLKSEFTINTPTRLTLATSYPVGTAVTYVQNEETGDYPDAAEAQRGVAEVATAAEVTLGTDDQRIVTPLKLKQRLDVVVVQATESEKGITEVATAAEVTAGADDQRIVTPLKLSQKLAGLTQAVNHAAPLPLPSAATTDIGAVNSNSVEISGTTTITALGSIASGACRNVRFTGSLTLTHNGTSLILPGGANIQTAANDTAVFLSLGAGNWICLNYSRSNGKPVAFAYDRSNVLGVVTQSGGFPTGPLMEYGTNAGGEFWKFASGLMICAKTVALGASTNTAGPIFTCTQSAIGSMPSTFASLPYVVPLGITNTAGGGWASCYVFWTASSWGNWGVYTEVSRAGATTLNLIAIGRWFL